MTNHNLAETTQIDEEIVAYLDGELDGEQTARVVRRLSEDATYRARLWQLQHAWDLLDTLRRTEADDQFVQSTVAMVAVEAEREAHTQKLQAIKRRSVAWVALAAIVLLAGAVGFVALRSRLTRENRALVRDLPIIERVDEYRNIDSLEFLKKLERENLFAAEVNDGT